MSQYSYTPLSTREPSEVSMESGSAFSYASQTDYKSFYKYNRGYDSSSYEIQTESTSALNRVCTAAVSMLCHLLVILTLPISVWFTLKKVHHHERLVVFRLGRLLGATGPGMVLTLPCIDRAKRVDLRPRAFSVPPQKIISSDGAVIELGAEIYFIVKDAVNSIIKIQDLNHSLRVLCHTTLRNHLGKRKTQEIESDRNNINKDLQADINKTTSGWGIEVKRVELSMPKVIQRDNPLVQGVQPDPLKLLGQMLFPPGSSNSNNPFAQMASQMAPNMVQHATPQPLAVLSEVDELSITERKRTKTVAELIEDVRAILNESLVREVGYIYQFEVEGQGGGTFYLDLKNGCGSVGIGVPPGGEPDTTLAMSGIDLQSMLSGDLKPFNAYMSGLLQVGGDLRGAMQLKELIAKLDV